MTIFGVTQKLFFTSSSGHCCIPLGMHISLSEKRFGSTVPILHSETSQKSSKNKYKAMKNLHLEFSHATYDRTVKLLKDADVQDPKSFSMLKDVCSSCQICKIYKRTQPRPAVGLSTATEFNETVAMDLKEWTKDESEVWFLHLVDHATRFSQSMVIRSKRKKSY